MPGNIWSSNCSAKTTQFNGIPKQQDIESGEEDGVDETFKTAHCKLFTNYDLMKILWFSNEFKELSCVQPLMFPSQTDVNFDYFVCFIASLT